MINRKMGVLYQARLADQFTELKQMLQAQKAEIEVRYQEIDQSEQRMNEQLKVDLKRQLPEIQTYRQTLNESIALA